MATEDTGRFVECAAHGRTDAAFVCRHLAGARGGPPLGFHQADIDPANPERVGLNGWCHECDGIYLAEGGWNDASEEFAGVTLICAGCFLALKLKHGAEGGAAPRLKKPGLALFASLLFLGGGQLVKGQPRRFVAIWGMFVGALATIVVVALLLPRSAGRAWIPVAAGVSYALLWVYQLWDTMKRPWPDLPDRWWQANSDQPTLDN